MNLKKKIYITAIASAVISLASCDNINENDRYIELPKVEAKRVVLLEEFTGQNCVNCPEAHEVVTQLLGQYPDNLISVSIHAGPLAMSEDKMRGIGLATAEGEEYLTRNNVNTVPSGVVNRTSGVVNKDAWAASIRTALEKPADLDMKVSANLSADGTQIQVTTNIAPYANIAANLQLWVVENGIVSLQLTPSGFKADYEHSHVFRSTVNGIDGESVSLITNIPATFEASTAVKETWNKDNLSIVAFLYDKSGVLQATECHVATSQNME